MSLVIDYVNKNNVQPKSLLDYGAGTGHLAVAFKEKFSIPKVIATDITTNGMDIELLKKHKVDFSQASQPKDVNEKFDMILSWAVFHYLDPKQCQEYLSQFAETLNDNGTLILGAWSSQDKFFEGQKSKTSASTGITMYSGNIPEDESEIRKLGLVTIKRGNLTHKLDDKTQKMMGVPHRLLLRYCFLQKSEMLAKYNHHEKAD